MAANSKVTAIAFIGNEVYIQREVAGSNRELRKYSMNMRNYRYSQRIRDILDKAGLLPMIDTFPSGETRVLYLDFWKDRHHDSAVVVRIDRNDLKEIGYDPDKIDTTLLSKVARALSYRIEGDDGFYHLLDRAAREEAVPLRKGLTHAMSWEDRMDASRE